MKMRFTYYAILLLMTPFFALSQPIEKANFSVSGGFYEESPLLEIFPVYQHHHVRFTTNGNCPTTNSQLYTSPLLLDESLYSTSDIYTIQISPDYLVYVPDSIRHCIVIRAAVFDENDSCVSEVTTNSYFIHSLGCDTHGLPAVSLCADSLDLFDYERGILVPGMLFDTLNIDHTGNYYMHGIEWERKVNMEFRECTNNEGLNQICGLRTHGNRSRRYPSKGLKVYAREEYGKKRFDYNFFNDSTISSYKHLVLKPFASFWPYSGAQDYFCNKLALQLGLPSSDCRPVVVFINGENWGVYFIQEKMDERFLEDHFETDINICNIIGDWHGEVECGDGTNFNQMMNWLRDANLDDEESYQHICDLIDIDNFVDYMVFETFIANNDWPGNNMRCWQEGDGKWRWIFFDGDAAILNSGFDVFTAAAVYTPPSTWLNYPEAKLLFEKLLENQHFKTTFEARARELCGGPFLYENTYPLLHGILEALSPNIENQSHRFGYPPSLGYWISGNNYIYRFLEDRVENYLYEWSAFAALNDFSEEMIGVYPNPTSGEIHLRLNAEGMDGTEFAIYDVLGRKVFVGTFVPDNGNEITFNPGLPAGVYVLKIGKQVVKIICR